MGDEDNDLFEKLPHEFREKFTQEILSRTTPGDVVRMSLVSKSFQASADSDVVWDRFIPPDHSKRLLHRYRDWSFDSSREIYFFLCTFGDEDIPNRIMVNFSFLFSLFLFSKQFHIPWLFFCSKVVFNIMSCTIIVYVSVEIREGVG